MRIFLALLLAFPLLATELLNYSVYEREDRVDIMLSFDSAYENSLFQSNIKNGAMIVLSGLNTSQFVDKNLNSKIVENLTIYPKDNSTIIELKGSNSITIEAFLIKDGKNGLRIRATNKAVPKVENFKLFDEKAEAKKEGIKFKNEERSQDGRYISVIIVLFILLILATFLKKYLGKKQLNFKKLPSKKSPSMLKPSSLDEEVEVLYEKMLDDSNKVVYLKCENVKYLVIVGKTNIKLDSFVNQQGFNNQSEFEVYFEENRQKLDNYLNQTQLSVDSFRDKLTKES